MRAGLVVIGCLLLAGRVAAADPEPRTGLGWQLYDEAFAALEGGDEQTARALLRRLLGEHAGEPAAVKAAEVIAVLDAGPGLVVERAAPDPVLATDEARTSQARAELALFQMVNGITIGIEICVIAECDGTSAFGLALAGGAVGVVASLGTTGDGVRPGARAAYDSGVAWGAINAAGLIIVGDPDDETDIAVAMVLGQGLGLVAGAALDTSRPRAGQVALANTTGMWAGALTGGIAAAAAGDDLDGRTATGLVLAFADLGLVAGAVLARYQPQVSRARTLVIDAAGIAGALAGAGIAVLASDQSNDRIVAGFGVAGAAIGLGTAAFFTRRWDF